MGYVRRPTASRMAPSTAALGLLLADSYHCSRYNTNTGRLTTAMFEAVFTGLLPLLEA